MTRRLLTIPLLFCDRGTARRRARPATCGGATSSCEAIPEVAIQKHCARLLKSNDFCPGRPQRAAGYELAASLLAAKEVRRSGVRGANRWQTPGDTAARLLTGGHLRGRWTMDGGAADLINPS